MRTFYVEVDTNDGDFVGKLVCVSDKDVKRWLPLIEKIRAFEPYTGKSNVSGLTWRHHHNFPVSQFRRTELGEKTPCEIYNISEDEMEDFMFAFRISGGENGFHTITQIVEVNISNKLI